MPFLNNLEQGSERRYPPLSIEEISSRLDVDVVKGCARWRDATKFHKQLNGREAGSVRPSRGKNYWHIKLNGIPYRRSAIIFAVANGRWPDAHIDHKNGDSMDDRAVNLREATITQNAWNHKTRAKTTDLPMGVRRSRSRFQARLSVRGRPLCLGSFMTAAEASAAYQAARRTHFGEYA